MTGVDITELEREADALADLLTASIEAKVSAGEMPAEYTLNLVSREAASGTNSISPNYLARLNRGEQRTDDFLRDAHR